MAKKMAVMLLLVVVLFSFGGCARGGGDLLYRTWKHFEWHLLGAYKDFVQIHKEIDMYVFNLDERNPDRY